MCLWPVGLHDTGEFHLPHFQPTVVNHGSWRNVHVFTRPCLLLLCAHMLRLSRLESGRPQPSPKPWSLPMTATASFHVCSPQVRVRVYRSRGPWILKPLCPSTGMELSISSPRQRSWRLHATCLVAMQYFPSSCSSMADPRSAFEKKRAEKPMTCCNTMEESKQSNPLMPAFLALGQHGALDAIQRKLRLDEKSSGIPTRFFVVGTPARMATVHTHIETELLDHMPTQVLRTHEQHATFLERINAVPDLLFRAAAAVNCLLRVWHPSWFESFAQPTTLPCGTASAAFTDNAIEGKPRRSAV